MKSVRVLVWILIALTIAASNAAAADRVIFIVRHAERAPASDAAASKRMMADDPPLSAAGQQRAVRLAGLLAESGIQHIYTTEFLRARQTAAPLADKLNVKPVMSAAKDPDPLIAQLRQVKGNVLIVGHANTIPDLLKKLGVKSDVKIGESDYGDLFIVVLRSTGQPTLVKLRF